MSQWQPIETAPKRKRVLLFVDGMIVCGQWDDDRFAKKPRPHWINDQTFLRGAIWTRNCQPTCWMPLPEIPKRKKK